MVASWGQRASLGLHVGAAGRKRPAADRSLALPGAFFPERSWLLVAPWNSTRGNARVYISEDWSSSRLPSAALLAGECSLSPGQSMVLEKDNLSLIIGMTERSLGGEKSIFANWKERLALEFRWLNILMVVMALHLLWVMTCLTVPGSKGLPDKSLDVLIKRSRPIFKTTPTPVRPPRRAVWLPRMKKDVAPKKRSQRPLRPSFRPHKAQNPRLDPKSWWQKALGQPKRDVFVDTKHAWMSASRLVRQGRSGASVGDPRILGWGAATRGGSGKGVLPGPSTAALGRWPRSQGGDAVVKEDLQKSVQDRGPLVESRPVRVSDALPRSVVRRVIQKNLSQIRYCYERGMVRQPGLTGRVRVRFEIGSRGLVRTAKVARSSLGDARVERCILKRIRRWRFPKPRGGGQVVVHYPFVLRAVP